MIGGTVGVKHASKAIDGDAGCFHRGHGGGRSRKVRRARRAIERRVRQASRRLCGGAE